MSEGHEVRVPVHEAGHAVAYLVIGRPIERAIVAQDEHQVDPVKGTHVAYIDEAVAMAAGWAAEERRLRLAGLAEDEIHTAWISGGHHNDRAMLSALAERVDSVSIADAEAYADQLVEQHWDLILTVASALLEGEVLDQSRMEALGAQHGVRFVIGDETHVRTGASR